MILIKLVNNEEFILDERYDFSFEDFEDKNLTINPNKFHQVHYRYMQLSDEYKRQMEIEEVNASSNKILEYGFTPMNNDPNPYSEIIINKNNILYFGQLKEGSGLYSTFIQYKQAMKLD